MVPRFALSIIIALLVSVSVGSVSASVSDATSAEEQWFIYELNRARANPALYGETYGFRLDLPPSPPLAVNADLASSTGFKADELLSGSYCGHRSPLTGVWPTQLARDFGFPLPDWWDGDTNYVEAIWCSNGEKAPATPQLILGSHSGPHIAHLLGQGLWIDHHEVGVGITRDPSRGVVLILHTGMREPTAPFVTGVVFDDVDGDGIMDLGEGLAGVEVTVGNTSTITNAGGGYAVLTAAGAYEASIPGTASVHVLVSTDNVGVDFRKAPFGANAPNLPF